MFSRATLQPLATIEHIRQSIVDIITTPLGTRLINRGYGSGLFALLDAPYNLQTHLAMVVAVGEAIERWEQRVKVDKVTIDSSNIASGTIGIVVAFVVKATGVRNTVEAVV